MKKQALLNGGYSSTVKTSACGAEMMMVQFPLGAH